MRVLVFGGSIAQGYWDLEYGGWVQRLRRQYDQESFKNLTSDWPTIFNLGISGDTTAALTARFAAETETRRWPGDSFAVVFAIGQNDTVTSGKEKGGTPEVYGDELDVLYSAAGHYTDRILFVGLTPVDDKLCNPWIYSSKHLIYQNKRILKFEEVLRKFCLKNNLPCVQVFEKFQADQDAQELLADGLHPNDAGHQLIADLVKPELDKLLTDNLQAE